MVLPVSAYTCTFWSTPRKCIGSSFVFRLYQWDVENRIFAYADETSPYWLLFVSLMTCFLSLPAWTGISLRYTSGAITDACYWTTAKPNSLLWVGLALLSVEPPRGKLVFSLIHIRACPNLDHICVLFDSKLHILRFILYLVSPWELIA